MKSFIGEATHSREYGGDSFHGRHKSPSLQNTYSYIFTYKAAEMVLTDELSFSSHREQYYYL